MDLKGYPQWTTPAVCLKNTLPIPCFIISIFLVKLATFGGGKSPDFCFDALKLRLDVFKWESQNGGYPHFMAKKNRYTDIPWDLVRIYIYMIIYPIYISIYIYISCFQNKQETSRDYPIAAAQKLKWCWTTFRTIFSYSAYLLSFLLIDP